jgi:1,4-dihydroxy-2-naphthoyl-CoA hydrolase
MQAAGLVLDNVQSSRVTGRIDLRARHHQPWRLVHGGVYTTAIETAASAGASTAAQEHGLVAVGVNNNTNFLRSLT